MAPVSRRPVVLAQGRIRIAASAAIRRNRCGRSKSQFVDRKVPPRQRLPLAGRSVLTQAPARVALPQRIETPASAGLCSRSGRRSAMQLATPVHRRATRAVPDWWRHARCSAPRPRPAPRLITTHRSNPMTGARVRLGKADFLPRGSALVPAPDSRKAPHRRPPATA